MEIKTDPENTRYVIVEGAKRQTDEWDTTEQGVVQPKGTASRHSLGERAPLMVDVEEQRKLLEDPFARLEKDEDDKVKASEQHQIISKLYGLSHRQWSDPYTKSQSLRKAFREEKKVLKRKSMLTEEIRSRNGLHIDLLPEAEEDTLRAKAVEYEGKSGREASLRRREVKSGAMVLGRRGRNGRSKVNELERAVKLSTRERADPFLHGAGVRLPTLDTEFKVVKRGSVENGNSTVGVLVDGYSSDSD
jgi:coiled-coil domain-containing protein 130